MNLSTFLFRSSVFIITIALLLSALAIEASLFWRVFFMQFMLYCCLLWSMFCVFGSNLLIAFSVSVINSFTYSLGSCSIAYLGPNDSNFVCSFVSFMLDMFIILCFCSTLISFCVLLCLCLVLCVSASVFCKVFGTVSPLYHLSVHLTCFVHAATCHCVGMPPPDELGIAARSTVVSCSCKSV